MIPEAVRRAVEEVGRDHVSGASTLARRVVEVFRLYLEGTDRRERCYRDLRELARALAGVQPGMASIPNVAFMCAEGLKRSAWRGYGEFLEALGASLEASARRIAERAPEALPPGARVVTLSRSRNVLGLLRAAHGQGLLSGVVVLASAPGREGLALARELAALGIPTTVVADAAGPSAVAEADVVLTGCDALLADGAVVNKVGTLGLALAAREFSVPFRCAAEAHKVDPRHSLADPPALKEGPGDELAPPGEGLAARNPFYDLTPGRLVEEVIWEEGLTAPAALAARFRGVGDLLDYYGAAAKRFRTP